MGHHRRDAAKATSSLQPLPVLSQGIEIAVGENHVQALHARPVFKKVLLYALSYLDGHFAVERREIAQSALFGPGYLDDFVQLLYNLIDILRHHGNPKLF